MSSELEKAGLDALVELLKAHHQNQDNPGYGCSNPTRQTIVRLYDALKASVDFDLFPKLVDCKDAVDVVAGKRIAQICKSLREDIEGDMDDDIALERIQNAEQDEADRMAHDDGEEQGQHEIAGSPIDFCETCKNQNVEGKCPCVEHYC